MNNFNVIQTIDDILSRVVQVQHPEDKEPEYMVDLVKHNPEKYLWMNLLTEEQWLLSIEPKNSFEFELVRRATILSAPLFPPPSWPGPNGFWSTAQLTPVELSALQHNDGSGLTSTPPPPRDTDGKPLKFASHGQNFSVDFHIIHSLHVLRAVLLVLLDAATPPLVRTPDFLGHQPAEDSLKVLDAMKGWSLVDFVPNAKYWKDWPLASFLRNPYPKRPSCWTHGLTPPLRWRDLFFRPPHRELPR